MLIKWLIFLVSLMAHFWLWGRWSLENSMGNTIMLVVASLLLMFMVLFPIRSLIHKKNAMDLFQTKWMQGVFYLYILLVIFLSILSFTGIIMYLLPIKIFLLGIYAFIKFKLKKTNKKT